MNYFTGNIRPTVLKRNKSTQFSRLDAFEKTAIQRKVHSFFARNELPNLNKVLVAVNEDPDLPHFSRTTLWRVLRGMHFRFCTRQRKSKLIDRPDIIAWRASYLQKIRRYREEGRRIYYTDETWVNAAHTTSKCWIDESIESSKDAFLRGLTTGLKNPTGKGGRLIVLHIGSELGFVDGGALIFEANRTSDYHDEMTGTVFNEWFRSILPELDANSVVVLDNASYHSLKVEKIPNSNTKKDDIKAWLNDKKIPYQSSCLKKDLLQKVSEASHFYDDYVVDALARDSGRTVVRLPPYHCELNPIELVWANMKSYVARHNREFKMTATKQLLIDAIANITPEFWNKCVNHVIEKVEPTMMHSDNITERTVAPMIIHLDEESDSDDGFDDLFPEN